MIIRGVRRFSGEPELVLPVTVRDEASGRRWWRRGMGDSAAMAVNLIRSTRLFPGVPCACAARASQGDLIFTAGACPLDEQGQVVAPHDVSAQMRHALRNLQTALQESGAAVRDVLEATGYVASSDRGDLVTAWDEVAGFFAGHDAPSNLLGVAVLGYPGQLAEIEAIAVAPAR